MVQTRSEKKAEKSNKNNLNVIKSLFLGGSGGPGLNQYGDEMYAKALEEINKIGPASREAAMSRERQQLGGMNQNLASSGLWSPGMAQSASRGIRADTSRTLGSIEEELAKMRAGIFTGQAGFRQQNMGQLASLLGGVQYNPGTTMGDALKAGLGFGGLFGGNK